MRRLGLIRPWDLVLSLSRRRADRCWPLAGLRGGQRGVSSHVLWIACGRLPLRGRAVCRACDVPHAHGCPRLKGTMPVVWLSRRLESVGKRGAWLWKQINFVLADLCGGERGRWDVSVAGRRDGGEARLWQTTDVNRACCQHSFSARDELDGARMVHIGVGGLVWMLGYFTAPFGSGCWTAPTDRFGSTCVASTKTFM